MKPLLSYHFKGFFKTYKHHPLHCTKYVLINGATIQEKRTPLNAFK